MKSQNCARRSDIRSWFSAAAFFLASFPTSQVSFSFATPSQQSQSTPAASTGVVRQIGAIKAINGENLTLTPDSGPEVDIAVEPTTRIVRVAPGDKDLKNATPIRL